MTAGEGTAREGLSRLWSRLAARPRLILVLLCLALWSPGTFSLPPLDRDESLFAQSSKQMLESGNFIDIRFGSVPRYKKPVGIYWLQAAATALAGLGERTHIWTYRLPSLLGGIIAVWLAFWCARAFASAEIALLAAALLAATLLLTAEATIATTDAVLLACILGVQGVLLRAYLAGCDETRAPPGFRLALAGWTALAFGILVKGPLVVAVAALTIIGLAAWDRRWRWLLALRPLAGLPLALAIVSPWLIAIALASHGAFFQQSLGHDFAGKLAGAQETHGAPPGYYLVLSTISFWPAIMFLLPAVADAVMRRAEPAIRFLLVWAGGFWVLSELVPTKLPHYVLPIYPALAVLAALWALAPHESATSRWPRRLGFIAAFQFALGIAGFAAALIVLPALYGAGAGWLLIMLAILGSVLGLAGLIVLLRGHRLAAAMLAFAAALVFYPGLTAATAPRLEQLWISPRAARLVAAHKHAGDPPVALAGYGEPSLIFLLGTDTRQTDGFGAADLGASQGGLALVEDRERPRFLARLAEREADADLVDELGGFNYSQGKHVHIGLYRVTQLHDITAPPLE